MEAGVPSPAPEPPLWPACEFVASADRMSEGIARLLSRRDLWVHRQVEYLEFVDPTVLRRRTRVEFGLPLELAGALAYPRHPDLTKAWYVVPLGFTPKPGATPRDSELARPRGELRRFELEKPEGILLPSRLTAELVARLVPRLARGNTTAPWPGSVLDALRKVARSTPQRAAEEVDELARLLGVEFSERDDATTAWVRTVERVSRDVLAPLSLLAVAVELQPGAPVALCWAQDIVLPPEKPSLRARLGLDLLRFTVPSPAASQDTSSSYIVMTAPDWMDVEQLAVVDHRDEVHARDRIRRSTGAGAVYLPARDRDDRDLPPVFYREVQIDLGLARNGLPGAAAATSLLATLVLWIAYAHHDTLPAGAGSTLVAAPGLIVGAVTGFAGGRLARGFAGPLRIIALLVALLAVLGAIAIAVYAPGGVDRAHALLALAAGATALTCALVAAYLRRPCATSSGQRRSV